MSNIHERGLTLAKKLSYSDTSNDNQKGLSCAVTMGRWRQEALSATRLNASHWFANGETIHAEAHDGKNRTCLFDSGGNQLFFHITSNSGQFSDLKMTVSKLQFLVHWLVTGRMTPTLPPTAPPPPATDTPPRGDLQWRIWLSVLFWEHICALPRSPPPLRLLCARLAWSLLLLWPYGEQCACLLQPGKRCRAGVRIKCCYEMRHVFFGGFFGWEGAGPATKVKWVSRWLAWLAVSAVREATRLKVQSVKSDLI